jgi:hypothetical protein
VGGVVRTAGAESQLFIEATLLIHAWTSMHAGMQRCVSLECAPPPGR